MYCEFNLVYGVDGEMVLERDFEEIFPMQNVPADKSNIPLHCFSHVKGNIEDHLRGYTH